MLSLSLPAKVFWKVVYQFFDLGWLRYWHIGLLNGENVSAVQKLANTYVKERLAVKKMPSSWNIISKYENVVLVSASIEPVIRAVHQLVGSEEYFCTRLKKNDGQYTGEVNTDLQGNKDTVLKDTEYSSLLSQSAFITDNKSDLKLLKMVKQRFIVSKEKNKSFWEEELGGQDFKFVNA